ncbi:MAG: PH domain-containing protein [Pedobacter sp.]|nr:PH domain-containing protein [Pedobacter sp.]
MAYDFSKPQRQSAIGIIIMAADTTRHFIKALMVPIVVAIIKLDKEFLSYFSIGILVLFSIVSLYAYLSYRRFTFYLDAQKQEFVINKGVFNLTQLVVQLDKIQQVNINQNLLQKIIGIYGLKVDTAGAEGHEVSIRAIPQGLAISLRSHLLNRTPIQDAVPVSALPEETTILKVSVSTLFKTGLTSNYGRSIGLLLAFIYPLYHTTKELLQAFKMDKGQVESLVESAFSLFSIGILMLVVLLIIIAINIISTLVKFFDFQISKHQHALLLSAGLLAKKNTLLSPHKVQVTAYRQNYFQKKMNLLNMKLKQADSGHAHREQELQSANLEIPGCNAQERDEIITMILGKIPSDTALFLPNWRFLNLPILFRVLLPVAIFLLVGNKLPVVMAYWPLAVCYSLFAVFMIYISYRRHALSVNEEFIIKKSGIWDVGHEIILPHKIQAITVFQYPWHKSVDVGHVNLHTAAGIIHFKYGNYTEIKKLANYWLYQVESSGEEWM